MEIQDFLQVVSKLENRAQEIVKLQNAKNICQNEHATICYAVDNEIATISFDETHKIALTAQRARVLKEQIKSEISDYSTIIQDAVDDAIKNIVPNFMVNSKSPLVVFNIENLEFFLSLLNKEKLLKFMDYYGLQLKFTDSTLATEIRSAIITYYAGKTK